MEEVVITGIGLINSRYRSPETLFNAIKNKKSCIDRDFVLEACKFPNPISARLSTEHEIMLEQLYPELGSQEIQLCKKMARYSADQAVQNSGLDLKNCFSKKGLFVGCNKINMSQMEYQRQLEYYHLAQDILDLDQLLDSHSAKEGGAPHFYLSNPDAVAQYLARHYEIYEEVSTHSDACSAGTIAIGNGFRAIRSGQLDVALCGGTEQPCQYLMQLGFAMVGARAVQPSDTPEICSRPFDAKRNGCILADASAFLVLESKSHAEQRGASILAVVSGFSKANESFAITSSDPEGIGYSKCMTSALADANLPVDAVDHINAHGTGTVANDSVEAKAIHLAFGERAQDIPITANKSACGHSLATSGVIEAILSALSLRHQTLLPTLNFRSFLTEAPPLSIVTHPASLEMKTILSNSFGFGGQNSSLILQALSVD